jgi:hypothetical protein
MTGKIVNMDKEMARQILNDQLNMRKVCAKMILKNLTQEQKDISSDIMEQNTERDVLESVITCDETWIFQYNPEMKRQPMHWKIPAPSPRMK